MGKLNRKSQCKDTSASSLEPTHACVTIAHYIAFAKEKRRKVYPPIVDHKLIRQDITNERIHIVDEFLLEEECVYFINTAERMGFAECEQAASKEYAHRNNGRIQVNDEALAGQIFDRLLPVLPPVIEGKQPCGCSSNIRLYRYTAGQSFGKHIDEAHYDECLNGTTKYTLLVYLNSAIDSGFELNATDGEAGGAECVGGETAFYQGIGARQQVVAEVVPQAGRLLLHGHGARCLTHEGKPVLSGVKYLLRTDVVYR